MKQRTRKAMALLSASLLLLVQAVPAFALCPCEMSPADSCCSASSEPAEPADEAGGCCGMVEPESVATAGCCTAAEPAAQPGPANRASPAKGCCGSGHPAPSATLVLSPQPQSSATAIASPCCERTKYETEISSATVPAAPEVGHTTLAAAAVLPTAMDLAVRPSGTQVSVRGPPGAGLQPPFLEHTILLL